VKRLDVEDPGPVGKSGQDLPAPDPKQQIGNPGVFGPDFTLVFVEPALLCSLS
jgi:hypothetical protein